MTYWILFGITNTFTIWIDGNGTTNSNIKPAVGGINYKYQYDHVGQGADK
jgi:hypothetical protein